MCAALALIVTGGRVVRPVPIVGAGTGPLLSSIPRDQELVLLGGESSDPREYDPATGHGDSFVFSGLVTFDPRLHIVPDLARSWDVGARGAVYTFHLRRNARFHDGRPVTARDVVYSWERAAAPATDSDTVLTYLGDIVGVRDRFAGKARHIRGLRVLDDHTLRVTLDAPKPYFLGKLTYPTAAVVDRFNVASDPNWYRTPNGSGPYRLLRWQPGQYKLYERFDRFYLGAPRIRYVLVRLFAGVGIRLYETGDIDMTGVGSYNAESVRDPQNPLHRDLVQGVDMCTEKVTFDVTQPPFDDPEVRQAFALSVDRQRYVDLVLHGVGLPARGLYPPSLPGYDAGLAGQTFDPAAARRMLARSRYKAAGSLPPIVLTTSGFGSYESPAVAALAAMWQRTLGVSIGIENVEPDRYIDELHAGRHGGLFFDGWCADYPDPENFADVLFHSGAQANLGHYSNRTLDLLLERARVEPDVTARLRMYDRAQRMIVGDAAAIFLAHDESLTLVKPYVGGYVFTPLSVPIVRYLSLRPH